MIDEKGLGQARVKNTSIEKTITINAPPDKVWRVFTDPELTARMGGEYATDWQVGSTIGWKMGDEVYTQGTIREIVAGQMFKYAQTPSVRDIDAEISYELEAEDDATLLHAREVFTAPITDEEYADAEEGWDIALQALKAAAEA